MSYNRKERSHWDSLIDLRLQYIGESVSSAVSVYRRRFRSLDSIDDRIEFLRQLDRRSSKLEGILSLEKEQKREDMERSPYSIRDYYKHIGASKETQDKIKYVVDNPDKRQINRILAGKKPARVANKIGVNYYTFITIKNNMLRGEGKLSANYAKFVQYLISESYQVKGYKS